MHCSERTLLILDMRFLDFGVRGIHRRSRALRLSRAPEDRGVDTRINVPLHRADRITCFPPGGCEFS